MRRITDRARGEKTAHTRAESVETVGAREKLPLVDEVVELGNEVVVRLGGLFFFLLLGR